jgi:hypothetical protein
MRPNWHRLHLSEILQLQRGGLPNLRTQQPRGPRLSARLPRRQLDTRQPLAGLTSIRTVLGLPAFPGHGSPPHCPPGLAGTAWLPARYRKCTY